MIFFLWIKTTTSLFQKFTKVDPQKFSGIWLYVANQWILKIFRNADFPILLLVIWAWNNSMSDYSKKYTVDIDILTQIVWWKKNHAFYKNNS